VKFAVAIAAILATGCVPVTTETSVDGVQCIGLYVKLKASRAINKVEQSEEKDSCEVERADE
jgi:hypothetical protein